MTTIEPTDSDMIEFVTRYQIKVRFHALLRVWLAAPRGCPTLGHGRTWREAVLQIINSTP